MTVMTRPRVWGLCFALAALAGCEDDGDLRASSSPSAGATDPAGTYRVDQRCSGLGPVAVDLTARDLSGNQYLLLRADRDAGPPFYAAVDHLEMPRARTPSEAAATASDGLPLYDWRAYPTKESGWLKDAEGVVQLPDEATVAYDPDEDRFFFEDQCEDDPRAARHAFRHQDQRLVLHALNVAMVEPRATMYHDADLRIMDERRVFQGGSGPEGVTEGHHDRNRHLQALGALMTEDARDAVPRLAEDIAAHRPDDPAQARRYDAELPAYLAAAARGHADWYLDAADIRLDWFHGNYPEGEAAIHDGMEALREAYRRLADAS